MFLLGIIRDFNENNFLYFYDTKTIKNLLTKLRKLPHNTVYLKSHDLFNYLAVTKDSEFYLTIGNLFFMIFLNNFI